MVKNDREPIKGLINSIQTLGAVDGPGIRFVVFMQGCPLRCIYCHNPETWSTTDGDEITVSDIIKKIMRYKNYFGEKGGVTISGGEALLQMEFVTEVFKLCKENNINTALDTSGIGWHDIQKLYELLRYTDLVICDVKFVSEVEYKRYTGGSLEDVIEFLDIVNKLSIKVWIRQVIVPGMNDNQESIISLNKIIDKYDNIERVELLPFRKLCLSKYENMNMEFRLKDTSETTDKKIEELYKFLKQN